MLLLAALRGKINGYREARHNVVRHDMAVREARFHDKSDRNGIVLELASHDAVRTVPLESNRLSNPVGRSGNCSAPGWSVRWGAVHSPTDQLRFPEPAWASIHHE